MENIIAKWESRGGKHYCELIQTTLGFKYRGNGCGGYISAPQNDIEGAIREIKIRVDSGYFLPDSSKTPMKRII